MGHKIVCLDCRKSFSQGTDFEKIKEINCVECGKKMTLLPHRFRAPKSTDIKKWETVKYLISNGFVYQHIYKNIEIKNGIISYQNYANYPENIRDAKEFVEKYKEQVIKDQ
jgi:hypothetical protein